MDKGSKVLSDVIVFSKYSQYNEQLNRRETWTEIIDRNKEMHLEKFPKLAEEIEAAYKYVYEKKLLPSMRSLQFAGKSIIKNNARLYNCLRRDTEFITTNGVKSFEDFEDGDQCEVLTHTGSWRKATIKCYGKAWLNKLTIRRGRATSYVFATSNHSWLLRNGERTTNVKVGDKLLASKDIFSEFDFVSASFEEKLYWCYGYVFGDGSLTKDRNGGYTHSHVRLCDHSRRFLDRFVELGFKTSSPLSIKGDYFVYTGRYLKTAPDPAIDSPDLIRAFVAGYLDADGARNTCKTALSQYNSIVSTGEKHYEFVRKCFPVSGVYINLEKDFTGQETNFGPRNDCRFFSISTNVGSKTNGTFSVREIEENVEYTDVWCLEVEEDHSFVLKTGLVTGNCAYLPIDSILAFPEILFLLLSGCGVGYSVRKAHVDELPTIRLPETTRKHVIGDSIEGWADAVKALMKAYLNTSPLPRFDYSDIRPKGAKLSSGGLAPGPEPLRIALEHVHSILRTKKVGDKLTTLDCHDIICHLSNAVLAGGIRRSALICLFDVDDNDMLNCKVGNWWELNPQRARANNSVVLDVNKASRGDFWYVWKRCQFSNSGEPGIYWCGSDDSSFGTNPCGEIALRSLKGEKGSGGGFCNLCEIYTTDIASQEDFNNRVRAAAFINTLQASYTDFHYLRPEWKQVADEDALLGIGLTGIADGTVFSFSLSEAANVAVEENKRVAELIGISPSARITTVKPSGTASSVLGCSSGIHARHSPYYLRRIRLGKQEPIYQYLKDKMPRLMEDEFFDPENTAVFSLPIKSPDTATFRTESPIDFLRRVRKVYKDWVVTGHQRGEFTHNVSATISIKDDEWESVGGWMWRNRHNYVGLSCLPYSDANYKQMPFEEITEEEYDKYSKYVIDVDLTEIIETENNTKLDQEAACSGGGGTCEIMRI